MASSVTAMIDDSSAVYYNPAGIAQGRQIDAMIGDTLIIPSFQYKSPSGTTTNNAFEVIPPFQAYVTAGLLDDLSVGVGVFTPYGSTVNWPDNWGGRSLIVTSQLVTYDINPTIAYRFGPLRVGAGLQVERATVDLKKKINTGAQEASTELGGDAWGVGANVGAQFEAIKQYLSIGVHYRSAVTLDFTGNAHFDNVPVELQSTIHDQGVSTRLTNPDSLQIGVASHPIPQLVVDADIVWIGWSKLHSIDINFPYDATGTLNTHEPKNWNNTVNYRVGGEYAVNDAWKVRAGVLYDPTPSPADTLLPDIPDADRLNLAIGASYATPSGFRFELGYQFLVLFKKTSTARQLPGDYSGMVNLFGLSVGYRTPTHPPSNEPPALPPPEYNPQPPPPPPATEPGATPPPPAGGTPPLAPLPATAPGTAPSTATPPAPSGPPAPAPSGAAPTPPPPLPPPSAAPPATPPASTATPPSATPSPPPR